MRIALAQHNFTVNDFRGNVRLILDTIARVRQENTDLVVFSELSVCGYPPQDLLIRHEFISSCNEAVSVIAKECIGIAAVVGSPSVNPNPSGKPLYNSAFLLANGVIASVHHKALLPTYDVFDEYRYFEPASDLSVATLGGLRLALTVCEDLWDDQPISEAVPRRRLYALSPMTMLAKQNPHLVVNLAASPFSHHSHPRRLEVFQGCAKRYGIPVVYVNQVGANTDLVFDGGSMVLNGKGEVICKMKDFEEDFRVIDTEAFPAPLTEHYEDTEDRRIGQIHDALVLGIRDFFVKMGFKRATLGLSGGIDSAVTLVLAQRALGSHALRVLLLPSQFSSQHSIDDSVELANNLGVQFDTISIQSSYDALRNAMEPIFSGMPQDIAEENIQARVRGTLLMALANKLGHLLLNTSNKSEAAVGYGTLYGDMNGALSVLGDVYKTDVYALARYINREKEVIPINTITKPPSAELRPGQKDSDSLPEYDVLDAILFRYIEGGRSAEEILGEGFDASTVLRTIRLVNTSEHKRFQAPPVLRVSSRAFGSGIRMPLVARY